jgi:hypothetical protein
LAFEPARASLIIVTMWSAAGVALLSKDPQAGIESCATYWVPTNPERLAQVDAALDSAIDGATKRGAEA